MLGIDGIDDHGDGGRNKNAQSAGTGDGTKGQTAIIAVTVHLGQGNAGHGSHHANGRTSSGSKTGAGKYGSHTQAARAAAQHLITDTEQLIGNASFIGQVTQQNEHRDCHQREGEDGIVGGGAKGIERQMAALGDKQAARAYDKHTNGNGAAQQHKNDKCYKRAQSDHQRAHACTSFFLVMVSTVSAMTCSAIMVTPSAIAKRRTYTGILMAAR